MSVDRLEDGKISECREVFNLFDKTGDGIIDKNELPDLMRAMNVDPADDGEVREWMNRVDKNRTGKVEFEEFLELFAAFAKEEDPEKELVEAFKIFDKDGSGKISADELRYVMLNLGEKLTQEEADEMIKEADTNRDGQIDYAEFVKLLTVTKG